MKMTIRITVLSAVLGAAVLLIAPAGASGSPVIGATIDVLVATPQAWIPADGTPAQTFINGQPCGVGFVDGGSWQGADGNFYVDVLILVPAACAFPGAPIEVLVGGFAINEPMGWGVNVLSEKNGWTYANAERRLVGLPSGRWGGSVNGVPAGVTVEARIGTKVCGTATTVGSQARGRTLSSNFEVQVMPASPAPYGSANCGFPGAHIDFYVNGVKSNQAATWSPGLHSLTLSLP